MTSVLTAETFEVSSQRRLRRWRPRLGVDARNLLHQRTGVERFTFHVVDELAALRDEIECVLFVDQPVAGAPWEQWPHEVIVVPPRWRWARGAFDTWLAWELRPHLRERSIDAFFAPYHKFPFSGVPRFCALHGLEWAREPGSYGRIELVKQWFWFQLASRFSSGLITFADHTAREIRRLRPRFALPLLVVPEGVAPHVRRLAPAERSSAVLSRLGVQPPYVLSVCSLEPRKNVDGLIQAYARLVREHEIPEQLVLTGRSGRRAEGLWRLASELGVRDRTVFTGYVDDDELVQLYNHAAAFVYVSKCEGFGLPVIEAMACGAPVVTSDGSALGEVAGSAAVRVNPASIDAIAAGLATVLLDERAREALIAAGVEHARQFNWLETARGISGFIREQLGYVPSAAREVAVTETAG